MSNDGLLNQYLENINDTQQLENSWQIEKIVAAVQKPDTCYYKVKWVRYVWQAEDTLQSLQQLLDLYWQNHTEINSEENIIQEAQQCSNAEVPQNFLNSDVRIQQKENTHSTEIKAFSSESHHESVAQIVGCLSTAGRHPSSPLETSPSASPESTRGTFNSLSSAGPSTLPSPTAAVNAIRSSVALPTPSDPVLVHQTATSTPGSSVNSLLPVHEMFVHHQQSQQSVNSFQHHPAITSFDGRSQCYVGNAPITTMDCCLGNPDATVDSSLENPVDAISGCIDKSVGTMNDCLNIQNATMNRIDNSVTSVDSCSLDNTPATMNSCLDILDNTAATIDRCLNSPAALMEVRTNSLGGGHVNNTAGPRRSFSSKNLENDFLDEIGNGRCNAKSIPDQTTMSPTDYTTTTLTTTINNTRQHHHSFSTTNFTMTNTGDEKRFKCSACGKSFGRKTSLQRHALIHTGEKPWVCKFCDKTFNQNSILQRHMLIHKDTKLFQCEFCDKTFIEKSALRRHCATHLNVRPWKCGICGKEFRLKEYLAKHEFLHKGIKPYSCETCSSSFADPSAFKRHRSTHATLSESLECENCLKRLKNSRSLKKHLSTCKVFTCVICRTGFSSKDDVEVHRSKAHGRTFKCNVCVYQSDDCIEFSLHTSTHA